MLEVDYNQQNLFDLSTVIDLNASNVKDISEKVVRKIITKKKVFLDSKGLKIENEVFIIHEKVSKDPTMNLNLIRGCNNILPGMSAMMPSLSLVRADKEYVEPLRDRDKMTLDLTPRRILDSKGENVLNPTFDYQLGDYYQKNTVSNLKWSQGLNGFTRESRLLRKAVTISETNCIVSIYGLGIQGRLFSEGSQSGSYKVLAIDVYSLWNCEHYHIHLSMSMLRNLFADRPQYLKPGKKADLLIELFPLLYFVYTINIPPIEPMELVELSLDGSAPNSNQPPLPTLEADEDSNVDKLDEATPTPDDIQLIAPEPEQSDDTVVSLESTDELPIPPIQSVTHLDAPRMPPGYPVTVEEMIRIPPKLPEYPNSPQPVVTQSLRISHLIRTNGLTLRKKLSIEKQKLSEEIELKEYEELMAKPKRKRYMVGIRAMKAWQSGAILICCAYVKPLAPTTVAVKAHVFESGKKLGINIGLSHIRHVLNVTTPVANWSQEVIEQQVTIAMDLLAIRIHREDQCASLQFSHLGGSGVELGPFRTIREVNQSIIERNRSRWMRSATLFDIVDNMNQKPMPVDHPSKGREDSHGGGRRAHWCALGWKGTSRYLYGDLQASCRPVQLFGKGLRLTCRCKRIGGVYVTYTLYMKSRRLLKGEAPSWKGLLDELQTRREAKEARRRELEEEERKKREAAEKAEEEEEEEEDGDDQAEEDEDEEDEEGNGEEVDEELEAKFNFYLRFARGLALVLEVYLPYNTSCGGRQIPTGTRFRIEISKDDLYRIVVDHSLLATALSACYEPFRELASGDEVMDAEAAWDDIGGRLMSRLQWTVQEAVSRDEVFTEEDWQSEEGDSDDVDGDKSGYDNRIDSMKSNEEDEEEEDGDAVGESDEAGLKGSTDQSIEDRVMDEVVDQEYFSSLKTHVERIRYCQKVSMHPFKIVLRLPSTDLPRHHILPETAAVHPTLTTVTTIDAPSLTSSSPRRIEYDFNSDFFSSRSEEDFGGLLNIVTSTTNLTQSMTNESTADVKSSSKPVYIYPTLSFSKIIFSKIFNISCVDSNAPTLLMKVYLWQSDRRLGVICYPVEPPYDVYLAEPTIQMQFQQFKSLLFLEGHERLLSIQVFLSSELIYIDEPSTGTEPSRRRVQFRDETTAAEVKMMNDVVEDGYDDVADALLNQVAQKANQRFAKK